MTKSLSITHGKQACVIIIATRWNIIFTVNHLRYILKTIFFTFYNVINWSALARQYQVKKQEWRTGKKTADKSFKSTSSPKVWMFHNLKRGASKKMKVVVSEKKMKRSAGREITVPCPVTNENLKKLNQKILSGEYNVGELIVPRQVRLAQLCHIITRHIY